MTNDVYVMIPYSKLEQLMDIASSQDAYEKRMKSLERQNACLRGMFSDCMLEIQKIRDYVTD